MQRYLVKRPLCSKWRNLRLVMFESAITAGMLSMSIMTPFFLSVGLSQSEIALTQAIFTLVLIAINIPTGWLADRFSRKWANVIGDIGHALVLLGYATARTFYEIVFYETLAAIFLSISKGVDFSLLRHFAEKIHEDEGFFEAQAAKLAVAQHCCALVLVLLGGPIGAISFRLAIAASSVPYWLGGFASILIADDSEKLTSKATTPIRDMTRIVSKSLHDRKLRLRILVYAVGRQMTHGIIWVFTPMLTFVGVPLPVVSCAWALSSLACILGAKIAHKVVKRLTDWQLLLAPLIFMAIGTSVISISLNWVTVWLYLLLSLAQGWTSATFSPMIQRYVTGAEQTTVLSLTDVISNLLYVPTVWLIGWAADYDLRYATLVTLIVFGTLGLILLIKLLRE